MTTRRAFPLGLAAALLLAGLGLPAGATLVTVEQAYELTPDQVQLPDRSPGSLTVRPCSTCKPVTLQVTPATTWFIRPGRKTAVGQEALLDAFRAAAFKKATLVYVYYEPQTRRVNRVVLDAPATAAGR
ncbi:MAG: hypothetical protein ABI567_04355 [Gammaproteobacteria bacterium]